MKLINIGFGNMLNADRILCIISPDAAPTKRMIQDSKEKGTLIDATAGRKTKAVIVTDCESLILSYLTGETLAARVSQNNTE
ncbi:MAG TPA: DUF370 domain-containing protein [Clostridiales bacterium]|mgnify:CR=1 FL=1|jgi:regulator of extracellular matrix RemA (YlzA/DUF370 family)|nr:DUF370 domain-containing protein [Clostridiales bacterium]